MAIEWEQERCLWDRQFDMQAQKDEITNGVRQKVLKTCQYKLL